MVIDNRLSQEIIDRVSMPELLRALGFSPGKGKRTRCILHGGKNPTAFSFDSDKGVWHCFVCGEGGGKMRLVQRVLGLDPRTALAWLGDLAGVHLEDRPLSPAEHAAWVERRRQLHRTLPRARLWRRAAVLLAGELLDALCDGLNDHTAAMRPEIGEVHMVTELLRHLRRIDGPELAEEYSWWCAHYPGWTAALIRAAGTRERAERAAVLAFLGCGEDAA
jgi:hypothetical protein